MEKVVVIGLFVVSLIVILILLYLITKDKVEYVSVGAGHGFKVGFNNQNRAEQSKSNLSVIVGSIYNELTTRKAVLPLSENDLLIEILNSYYILFNKIREIRGELNEGGYSDKRFDKLNNIVNKILQKDLRSYLTKHQGAFRKWWGENCSLPKYEGKKPQDIQKLYPDHKLMVQDHDNMSKLLVNYSQELKKLLRE